MAIIIPEVFADAVNSAMDVSLRVARLATDYTDMVDDITTYGETVHFPTIDRINEAVTFVKGGEVTPNEISMTDAEATIKTVTNSVRIHDKDSVQVKGNIKDSLAVQLGNTMAYAVDKDLVTSIREDAVYKDDVAIADFNEMAIQSAFDVFGDRVDDDSFAGILINAKLRKYIVAMDAFTDANKTYATAENGKVVNGQIGFWNGSIPVVLSNNETEVDGKAMLAIVKKGALGYIFQKNATTEEEREAKKLATDLVASEMYATKLLHADGVSVLEVALSE